jgi:hypothetical protein
MNEGLPGADAPSRVSKSSVPAPDKDIGITFASPGAPALIRKRKLLMMCARVLSMLVVLAVLAGRPAFAQAPPRLEVGAQFSTLRLTDFDATNAGLGGRVSYDFTRWFAVEGELNFFPRDKVEVKSSVASAEEIRLDYRRRRLEGFAGPKIGVRRDRFGVFGTIQPGFARLTDKGVNCVGDDCARILFLRALPEYRTELAMNMGGVVEYYPTARTVARIDLGTTLIRHRSLLAPPCGDCTSRNFSSRVGFGIRF